MPATLPHHLRSDCLHAPPPLGSPRAKPPPLATAPHETATAHNTQHHPRTAGVCKHPLTAQLPPMHAAYHRGTATSAASSLRDSVPATLPHHLRCNSLHAPPPLGPPLAKPPTPATAPRAHAPAHSTQHHPCTAGVRKHPLTVQLPQMHAAYHGGPATSAASSLRDSVPATLPHHLGCKSLHAPPPLGPPLAKPPPPATAPRAPPSARNTQHHQRIAGVPKHPLTAQLPADARSAPKRSSDVSFAILPRLGASDAAPAAKFPLSARTTAPRLAPPSTPTTRYSPACNCRSPQYASAAMHSRRLQAPAHSAAAADARSVQLRSSDVSCVIPPRLGASDAASAAPIPMSARTAAPGLVPRKAPTTSYSPARNRPSPQHATSSPHSRQTRS